MSTHSPVNPSTDLAAARLRFDQWRSQHPKRTRLPQELWQIATALARQHGPSRTAQALAIRYASLKKHLQEPGPEPRPSQPLGQPFLEVLAGVLPAGRASLACTLECDDGHGGTLRMYLSGARVADLASLADRLRTGRP